MIPTLIVLGLVFGRWWRLLLPGVAVGWPVVLILSGAMGFERELLGAIALALANAIVGVVIHQAASWLVRGPLGTDHRSSLL